jgi:LPS sulfotransferase NodH
MPVTARTLKRYLKYKLNRSPTLRRTYFQLIRLYHQVRLKSASLPRGTAGNAPTEGVNPENVVWIFCTGRSGSTWLRSMIEELVTCKVWEEPKVGQLFGEFYDRARESRLVSTNFVMGDPTRKEWIRALRNFVLATARAAHPDITLQHYLVVKEPDGAVGAPLLMEALPESRMVMLVRDPRDVAASAFDASRKGSWRYEWHNRGATGRPAPDEKPHAFMRKRAEKYLHHMGNAKRAYDAHQGRKISIRYEDLKAETLETMRRLCVALGLPAGEKQIARVVEKHAWENIPDEEKGPGKFHRKATPEGWREDLTPEQAKAIEEITAPLLTEFYP